MNIQENILRVKEIMGIKEGIFDAIISHERLIDIRKNGIKKTLGDDFLIKAEKHPDFVFLISSDVKREKYNSGKFNKCETNTFNYVLDGIKENRKIYPVGGYAFTQSFFPIEHWWVYDEENDIFLEVTPFEIDDIICYAGIVGYDVRQQMIDKKVVFDKPFDKIDFFKGGYIHLKYFQ